MISIEEIDAGLTKAAIVFNYRLDQTEIEIIHELLNLKRWTPWSFIQAIDACIAELEWMPKPKQILDRYVAPPKVEPEQVRIGTVTESDNAEIEAMIAKIDNPHLRVVCRKFVGNYPTDQHLYEHRYRCCQCLDSGTIEVYDPRGSYQAAREGTLDPASLRSMMVACHCEEGDRQHETKQNPKKGECKRSLTRFDANSMCPVNGIGPEEQAAELNAFMQEKWTPRNYHSEFSDWA